MERPCIICFAPIDYRFTTVSIPGFHDGGIAHNVCYAFKQIPTRENKMIEINVGEKDTVRINWGEGMQRTSFIAEPHSTRTLIEKRDEMREEKNRLANKLMQAEFDLKVARQTRVDAGTPVYIIDTPLAEGLKELLKNCKPGPISVEPDTSEWKPISTAPRNGTQILVLPRPEKNSGARLNPVVYCWTENSFSNPIDFPGAVFDNGKAIRMATHWMPLPEPPR